MIANPKRAKREAARLSHKEDKRGVYRQLDKYAAEEWTQAWTLDDTDRAIIALYQEDARRAYADIGSYVNLSAPAVCRRVHD